MHRFFVPPQAFEGGELAFPEQQAHQIHSVLRLRPGETIVALDNSGREYQVELIRVAREGVRGRVVQVDDSTREPHTELVLYQSLLKADKFEWVLQKGTELGIAAFVPLVTTRVIAAEVGRTKRVRWERILVEAAEQSGRSKIPFLADPQELEEAVCAQAPAEATRLIPWEEERNVDLRTALRPTGPVHLFIGPEGGLTAEEIEMARAQGVQPITLGRRILRAETAGLVAASAIFYARGEMDAVGARHSPAGA